jgi:hypothetical protein
LRDGQHPSASISQHEFEDRYRRNSFPRPHSFTLKAQTSAAQAPILCAPSAATGED